MISAVVFGNIFPPAVIFNHATSVPAHLAFISYGPSTKVVVFCLHAANISEEVLPANGAESTRRTLSEMFQ